MSIRSLEILIQQYPEKTGTELLEIRRQDEEQEESRIQKINEKVLKFLESLEGERKYLKGSFGQNQKYYYRIDKVDQYRDKNDSISFHINYTKVLFFSGSERGVLPQGNYTLEVNEDYFSGDDIHTTGLNDCEPVTQEEWDKVINYIDSFKTFWD